jgi:hypothetical protein
MATEFTIDTAGPNGLNRIYSATFDTPLIPGGDAFFGGTPPAAQAITLLPNPSLVETVANTTICKQNFPTAPKDVPPCTETLYPVATPSALDLTLSAGNTELAINDGNIFFPNMSIIVFEGTADETVVPAEGASIIDFAPSSGTVPVDGNGVAVFEIEPGIPNLAADFATFTEIVTSCSGPKCILIPILSLDIVRYRLTIDWDPTFSFFTAEFIGQTQNNSMVFATFNSVTVTPAPDIRVTDSVAPVDDLLVPYGDVLTATSVDETVGVTNDGNADLTIGTLTQPDPPFSVLNDTCTGLTLIPTAVCTLTVRFAPTATGAFSKSFNIPSNDPVDNLVTMNVSGTGVSPAISITDTIPPTDDKAIPFAPTTVATTTDETVTVTNSGTADLIIGTLTQPAAPFSVLNDTCTGRTLAPAEPCTLTVRFAPAAAGGLISETFDIPSNDPVDNLVTINVSGTGTLALIPGISVTDSVPPDSDLEVPFGDVIVAPPIPFDETVTITSSGTGNLIIGTLTQPAAPFSVLNDTCSGQTLAPAAFCTLTVRFDPVTTGMFSDNFTIPSNDAGKPNTPVSLSGMGTLPVITVTDSVAPTDDLHIPYGSVIETLTAVETVTISNNSTVELTLGQATITDPLGPFSILTNNCSTPQNIIAPGNACTIDVQFLPDSVGTFASSLNIPSNDPNTATATVDVDGIGVPGPAPDISITDPIPPQDDLILPFGDVTEGKAWDRPVKITNEGNANLTIGAIAQLDSLAAPFSILSDTCSGQIIAPAADCTIDLRFLPATTGIHTDSFDIPSNDPNEPALIFNVDGTGVILGTGTISLEPEGASALSPTILLALLLLFAANLRRRYHW